MSPTCILLTLSVAALAGAAFGPASLATSDPVAQLQWVDHADVKVDFHRSVEEKHDTRFLAVNGIASNMILGIDIAPSSPLVQRHGFRTIQGTGDAMISKEHERLVRKAVKYAEEYNKMLLAYFHSHKDI